MKKYLLLSLLVIVFTSSTVFAKNIDLYEEIKQEFSTNNQLIQIDENTFIVRGSGDENFLNNYILFNNELWRILGFYNDHLKIIRATSIGRYPFDSEGSTIKYPDTTIGKYLNGSYYSGLDSNSSSYIDENGTWYIGKVTPNLKLYDSYANAKKTTWNGKVGIVAAYEYLFSSIGENCDNKDASYQYSCGTINNNWLGVPQYGATQAWTLSPYYYDDTETRGVSLNIINGGYLDSGSGMYSSLNIYPSVYLKENIKIKSGTGTKSNPYTVDWYIPYSISIIENNQTDSFMASVSDLTKVEYNEKVTFSLEPIKGYTISNITIKDDQENIIEYESTGNSNEYFFIMPSSNIKIIPEYEKIKSAIIVEKNSHISNIMFNIEDITAIEYQETVKFNISLENGYEIDKVDIKTADGIQMESTSSENEYIFTMPDKDVYINIMTNKKEDISVVKEEEPTEPEEEVNPQTSDGINKYLIILLISVSSLIVLIKVYKL